jgi:hypothetical protein
MATPHFDRSVLFQITLIQIQVATSADHRHDCDRLVQCGVTIEARYGTSDPDNGCPATKPQLTYDLDAAGSFGFTAVYLNRHRFSKRNH